MNPTRAVEELLHYAFAHELIQLEDVPYTRNLLMDALGLEPAATQNPYALPEISAPDTATHILDTLCRCAAQNGIIPAQPPIYKEMFGARLMGILTARPSDIADRFFEIERKNGAQAATDWFYSLCRHNNYIRVDDIARNEAFEQEHDVGKLIVTINLSKPEKDPATIALERDMPPSGYPRCMVCVENPGYAGRVNYPARQNHRMIPLELCGQKWYFQYSPYLYYDEHCIVLSGQHVPMRIERATLERMFAFVSRFPHYFIGSNADLPIVGGSILSHDHFQGGRYVFPMMEAGTIVNLKPMQGVDSAGIVKWPLSAVRLSGLHERPLIDAAEMILNAWRDYSDLDLGIIAKTDAPHNTITPILYRKKERYVLDIVLRNNRVSKEHPLGIFHPHAHLHHIKRENIGLIEVMGLFILPGRLQNELQGVRAALSAPTDPHGDNGWEIDGPFYKHLEWVRDIRARRGQIVSGNEETVLREELTEKCACVLEDCGVYTLSPQGLTGFLRFLNAVGIGEI